MSLAVLPTCKVSFVNIFCVPIYMIFLSTIPAVTMIDFAHCDTTSSFWWYFTFLAFRNPIHDSKFRNQCAIFYRLRPTLLLDFSSDFWRTMFVSICRHWHYTRLTSRLPTSVLRGQPSVCGMFCSFLVLCVEQLQLFY